MAQRRAWRTTLTLLTGSALAVGGCVSAGAAERVPTPPPITSPSDLEGMDPAAVQRERDLDAQQWQEILRKLPPVGTDSASGFGATTASKTGSTGEVWVSLLARSGSVGFAGHAAIIARQSAKTVESFSKSFSPVGRDGVVILGNSWGGRSKVIRLGVKGSSPSKRFAAASWSEDQDGKPYNKNFFDKNREDKFYCSQLVWKAWLKQGIDIEKGSVPNGAVTPADLVNSSNTTVAYRG